MEDCYRSKITSRISLYWLKLHKNVDYLTNKLILKLYKKNWHQKLLANLTIFRYQREQERNM